MGWRGQHDDNVCARCGGHAMPGLRDAPTPCRAVGHQIRALPSSIRADSLPTWGQRVDRSIFLSLGRDGIHGTLGACDASIDRGARWVGGI